MSEFIENRILFIEDRLQEEYNIELFKVYIDLIKVVNNNDKEIRIAGIKQNIRDFELQSDLERDIENNESKEYIEKLKN